MGPRRGCRGRHQTPRRSRRKMFHGFNGAATRVSRKTSMSNFRRFRTDQASMGPRRGCRGRPHRRGRPPVTCRHASMGPRRGCRGRRIVSPARHRDRGGLQWGRDEGVAEDQEGGHRPDRDKVASMGPRRGCRGRRSRGAIVRIGRSFNGAATRVSRKTPGARALRSARAGLQWGRDEGVAEDVRNSGCAQAGISQASMGPRRGCRGRRVAVAPAIPRALPASMGPRRGCRGRHYRRSALGPPDWASMGPRRGCRGRPGLRYSRPDPMPASMGPRRGCRGRHLLSKTFGRDLLGFNGAATRVSRKTAHPPVSCKITTCAAFRERWTCARVWRTAGRPVELRKF